MCVKSHPAFKSVFLLTPLYADKVTFLYCLCKPELCDVWAVRHFFQEGMVEQGESVLCVVQHIKYKALTWGFNPDC